MAKTKKFSSQERFKIGDEFVLPGERRIVHLNVGHLYDYTELRIPVEVIRGAQSGPSMFISAAIHGDEINGTEIIRQLSNLPAMKKIRGTLFLVPVVNVFGFNNKSRYLPDRRDLNRCFPGKLSGSLGSRLAHIFFRQIVKRCTHGIDLHTGALHRKNLPQIRAFIDHNETRKLAESFGVPVVIHSKLRDGSLREASRKAGVATLLYEGGEALRFDSDVIKVGLRGCLATMRSIGMLPKTQSPKSTKKKTFIANSSTWLRAPHSGSFRALKHLGDWVREGEVLAYVSDPFGRESYPLLSTQDGVVIGVSEIPLVNKGEAMFHVASFKDSAKIKQALATLEEFEIGN